VVWTEAPADALAIACCKITLQQGRTYSLLVHLRLALRNPFETTAHPCVTIAFRDQGAMTRYKGSPASQVARFETATRPACLAASCGYNLFSI
jgi:hypothetical protein